MQLPSKKGRVVAELLRGPANRFELEQRARDHVVNSTIAELRRDGLLIDSQIIEVAGFGGAPARIARYTLRPESRDLARQIVERSTLRRPGAA